MTSNQKTKLLVRTVKHVTIDAYLAFPSKRRGRRARAKRIRILRSDPACRVLIRHRVHDLLIQRKDDIEMERLEGEQPILDTENSIGLDGKSETRK